MEKRSRIKSYYLTILCAVLVLNFGCSDEFFNEQAGDRITPDQAYQSIIDMRYSSMPGTIIPLQDIMPRLIIYDGLRSDMMDVTPNADAYLNELNDQLISAGNPYTNPADLYKVIVNVNEVLANIDKVSERDKRADSLVVRAAKGSLLGMRAWSYLTILRLYGQAAYIDDNLTSLPADLTTQKILSKAVFLDTLINQVKPYIHDNTTYVEMRFGNSVNTKALLGELYLEKNDYVNAVTYLKKACESYDNMPALFKVDKTYKELAWASIFLNAESQMLENIFIIPFSSDEGQFNPLAGWTVNEYLVKPSTIVIDSFMAQGSVLSPVLGDQFRGLGYTFYVDTVGMNPDNTFNTAPFITKYYIPALEAFSTDIIISRASDIHLLLAEALNRLGDPVSQKYALMLLNDGVSKENPKPAEYTRWANNLGIRGRVSLKSRVVPITMLDADSITNTIEDFIMAERAMELAFEGKRWNDLVRVAERRGEPAYLADKVAAKFGTPGSAKYESVHGILMDPSSWYLK
jgi:tetratricopeptide (TPR) repeat protein